MLFNQSLSWYMRMLIPTFIIVSSVLVFIEIANRVPGLVTLALLLGIPIIWLIKLGGALFAGYKIGQVHRELGQSIVAGGLLGIGIGIVVLGINMYQKISHVQGQFFGIFGGFDVLFIIVSEMIIASFMAAIGGILAGASIKNLS